MWLVRSFHWSRFANFWLEVRSKSLRYKSEVWAAFVPFADFLPTTTQRLCCKFTDFDKTGYLLVSLIDLLLFKGTCMHFCLCRLFHVLSASFISVDEFVSSIWCHCLLFIWVWINFSCLCVSWDEIFGGRNEDISVSYHIFGVQNCCQWKGLDVKHTTRQEQVCRNGSPQRWRAQHSKYKYGSLFSFENDGRLFFWCFFYFFTWWDLSLCTFLRFFHANDGKICWQEFFGNLKR